MLHKLAIVVNQQIAFSIDIKQVCQEPENSILRNSRAFFCVSLDPLNYNLKIKKVLTPHHPKH